VSRLGLATSQDCSILLVLAWQVVLMDTAGLRAPRDEVEAEGIARAAAAGRAADLVLFVLDASLSPASGWTAGTSEALQAVGDWQPRPRAMLVCNKVDERAAGGPAADAALRQALHERFQEAWGSAATRQPQRLGTAGSVGGGEVEGRAARAARLQVSAAGPQ
jgi:tRNA U34 5-carboxymethylaminomethyl modifying GTPase MnmE/TrmE